MRARKLRVGGCACIGRSFSLSSPPPPPVSLLQAPAASGQWQPGGDQKRAGAMQSIHKAAVRHITVESKRCAGMGPAGQKIGGNKQVKLVQAGFYLSIETSKVITRTYCITTDCLLRFCIPPAQKSRGARPLLVARVRYDDADIYPGESSSRVYSERE